MPRALSLAMAEVAPEAEDAYLEALRALAARERARGAHLWVFRHPRTGQFVEFSESRSAEAHRYAQADGESMALEARLAGLARYAPDARTLWDEVPL